MSQTKGVRSSALRATLLLALWVHGSGPAVAAEAASQPYRSTPLSLPSTGSTGFSLLPVSRTGVNFTNRLELRRGLANQNLMNGSGVAAGDIDGDGFCDLYFCSLDGSNQLYRNRGDWRFEDITAAAGVACAGQDSTGATFVDIDGDGDLDLLVSGLGAGVRLFLNNGHGRFDEATDASGLRSQAGSTSMALADFDGDGDLDLYVTNIPRRPVRNEPSTSYQIQEVGGKPQVVSVNGSPASSPELAGRFKVTPRGEVVEYGEPDDLFLNNGNGTFTRLSFTSGRFLDEDGKPLKEEPMDWGLAVQFRDFNGDGLPDLYVCNDLFTPDRFWINQGGGRFKAIAALALRHTSLASMGMDVADINRDGLYDFFVADMMSRDRQLRMTQFAHVPPTTWEDGVIGERLQFNHNTLFLNRGDGTYAEIAFYSGVAASDWSWGGVFLDVDLDGYEDLLVSNGQQRNLAHGDFAGRIQAAQRSGKLTLDGMLKIANEFPPLDVPKMAFRNRGDLTFEEVGHAWGFDTRNASQGMALADLDNDGDLDVVVNSLLHPAGIYRNNSVAPRIAVRLRGQRLNRAGVGAQIKVTRGPVPQQQEMICGGRYLSSDEAMRVFATGTSPQLDIEVLWRSGTRSTITGALPNSVYEIDEPQTGGASPAPPSPRPEPPWFEDVSSRLNHRHVELPHNDLEFQPLLPYRLARSGPGISWLDLNDDGLDDLVIPGGQGGAMAVFLNQGAGGFRRVRLRAATDPSKADQTTVLEWLPGSTNVVLVAGVSNYKSPASGITPVTFFHLANSTPPTTLPALDGPVGPLAMADVDGDGDLDLFVGTTSPAGRHPEGGTGYLFRNDGGSLVLAARWEHLGIIKGAVFSDLDQDGYPELILACEWGPLRIFSNRQGRLEDATGAWRMLQQTGLWQGVTACDFDGDGRLDIVASNWGLNSALVASASRPAIFYHGDLDDDGHVEIIQVAVDAETQKEYPAVNLNLLAMGIPFVRTRATDYESYSRTTVQELLGDAFSKLTKLEIRTLASTVFLNRGDHFEARPLPAEAQFAPAFGVAAADFDGDGRMDLFLSQNSFVVGAGMSRQDEGRGLWLRGDGKGGFEPVRGDKSGLIIYGEQRGCAVADFDQDGRVDLAVAQNNGQTKLFINRRATPGLRVHLQGPPGNSSGIGAILRAGRDGQWGPATEVHAGAGYWSVDSASPVLPEMDSTAKVQVRWPGGRTTVHEVPAGAKAITAAFQSP